MRGTQPYSERDRPVDLAEAALVGGLLYEPGQVRDFDWMAADDFSCPIKGAVFGEIRRRVVAGEPADVGSIAEGMDQGSTLGWTRVALADLHSLLAATPQHLHLQDYAAIILEASTRREIHTMGLFTDDRAEAGWEPAWSERVAARAEHVQEQLDAQTTRWNQVDPSLLRPTVASDMAEQIQAVASQAIPSQAWVYNEELLVGAVLTQPHLLQTLKPSLKPEDFGQPEVGNTWRAIQHLAEQGHNIDAVTVAWQAQRFAPEHGPGMGTSLLGEVTQTAVPGQQWADQQANVVLSHTLKRRMDHTQELMRQAAVDPSVDTRQILQAAHVTTSMIRYDAGRLKEPPPSQSIPNNPTY